MANVDGNHGDALKLNELTERIIGCAFVVGKALGRGFLEKVYENALAHELRKAGLAVEMQRRLIVRYDSVVVGEYIADLVVNDQVLVEIKAARATDPAHEAQCINYLAATGLPLCLLLNFGARVEVRRIVGKDAPRFPRSNLGSSGSSVASSSVVPMTWSERAEFDED